MITMDREYTLHDIQSKVTIRCYTYLIGHRIALSPILDQIIGYVMDCTNCNSTKLTLIDLYDKFNLYD